MKRPNLWIIVIEEEETQVKGTENRLTKILDEIFPNLKKENLSKYKKNADHQRDWTRNEIYHDIIKTQKTPKTRMF